MAQDNDSMSNNGHHPYELAQFFPYRLAVLAEKVSLSMSQLYSDRFDLSRAEWRVLAALGANRAMAAKEIGPYSTLDKMQVSRAVARMEENGLISRAEDPKDRRAKMLRLTPKGQDLLWQIVPLVRAREEALIAALSEADRAALDRIMTQMTQSAAGLIARDAGFNSDSAAE